MLTLPRGKRLVGFFGGGIAVVAVIIVTLVLHANATQPAARSSMAQTNVTPEQKPLVGIPVTLSVPRLTITAPIDHMGVMPNGDMESPEGAMRTGWYKLGPRPGNTGSAVIAGHYGRWKSGEASVFDNLHTLKAGDKVIVRDDAGAVITFIVRETRVFGRDDDATTIFTSNDGKAHLNLITCQGTWDASKKTYSDRLVVFTDKE